MQDPYDDVRSCLRASICFINQLTPGLVAESMANKRIVWKDYLVARATNPRAKKKTSPPKPAGIDEKALTKGQLRKLGVLRKSLGDKIADKAFAEWLKSGGGAPAAQADKSAQLIADALGKLVIAGKLRIPRGGYLLTRGRGRVIVERGADTSGG